MRPALKAPRRKRPRRACPSSARSSCITRTTATYVIQDAYLYGADLFVAPVRKAGGEKRTVYLPKGTRWVHVWSGAAEDVAREVSVAAPLGQPAAFYRENAGAADLFADIRML